MTSVELILHTKEIASSSRQILFVPGDIQQVNAQKITVILRTLEIEKKKKLVPCLEEQKLRRLQSV